MTNGCRAALISSILNAFGAVWAGAQQKPIVITPAAPTVLPSQSISLRAYLTGADSKRHCPGGLKWTVNDPDHPLPSDGSITETGNGTAMYTAPKKDAVSATAPPPTVKAACRIDAKTVDSNFAATVTVTINVASCPTVTEKGDAPDCIRLRPETAVVEIRKPNRPLKNSVRRFTLERRPELSTPLQWSVDKNLVAGDVVGSLEPNGESAVYTAPGSVPGEQIEIEVSKPKDDKPLATANVVLVASHVFIHCAKEKLKLEEDPDPCTMVDFDRLRGDRGTLILSSGKKAITDDTSAAWVNAVNSSKVLATGSIVDFALPEGATQANCTNYDWKFVLQAEESPNILIYNPSDVGSGICYGNRFVIALPVKALWVDVTGFVQTLDPQRAAPTSLAGYKDCFGNGAPQSIVPCDRSTPWMGSLYHLAWIYTHFGQAGTAQGTISLPTLVGQGARQLNWDVQADPAFKAGLGWINVPIVFEKNSSAGSNLDSLLIGVAYDFHFLRHPNFASRDHFSPFVMRKPQFRLESGTEIAPTTPHDVNWIESATVKWPFVFTWHKQPSVLTVYPVMGMEGGWHVETHLAETNNPVRGLAGADASIRWPFTWTHNFLGGTPITLDYTYRERWLVNAEPTTNVANSGAQTLAAGTHIYSRSTLTAPFTPNLQFQLTYLRGGLPPEFDMLGNTVAVGITFTNPGSSEH